MKNMPIYNMLMSYHNRKTLSMHMPGHKQGKIFNLPNLFELDITEIDGADNLHNPKSIIKESQELASKLFGADKTFYLVNGSTAGIMAAIASVCNPGEELIVARNCHKSVYNGLIAVGVKPIYIKPSIVEAYNIVGGIDPEEIQELILQNKAVKGIIITSPTYEGIISDVYNIAKVVHKYNKVLIVDEAHGSHFVLNEAFPNTALQMGADVVIQSTHKTLPALTQTAMLHILGGRIDKHIVQSRLSLFQTTSPSYIFLATLDYCRRYLEIEGVKEAANFVSTLKTMRNQLLKLKNIKLVDKDIIGKNHIKDLDISKILIYCGYTNISGVELMDILRNMYNIELETGNKEYALALTSIADDIKSLTLLIDALSKIDKGLNYTFKKNTICDIIELEDVKLLPKEAYYSKKTLIHIKNSVNFISGEFLIPYPPGIPIICPGELITENIVAKTMDYINKGIEVIGINNNLEIYVVEV